MVNNRYEHNVFEQNAGAGFRIHDPSRHTATDYFLVDSFASGNKGSGFELDTTAGALIRGNHLYSNNIDININAGSLALRIVENYLEDPRALVRTRAGHVDKCTAVTDVDRLTVSDGAHARMMLVYVRVHIYMYLRTDGLCDCGGRLHMHRSSRR